MGAILPIFQAEKLKHATVLRAWPCAEHSGEHSEQALLGVLGLCLGIDVLDSVWLVKPCLQCQKEPTQTPHSAQILEHSTCAMGMVYIPGPSVIEGLSVPSLPLEGP